MILSSMTQSEEAKDLKRKTLRMFKPMNMMSTRMQMTAMSLTLPRRRRKGKRKRRRLSLLKHKEIRTKRWRRKGRGSWRRRSSWRRLYRKKLLRRLWKLWWLGSVRKAWKDQMRMGPKRSRYPSQLPWGPKAKNSNKPINSQSWALCQVSLMT